ncbi:hypothetical protein [Sulfitobacter sp. SK012]|uniref:hypothetical protein n=1 Tax=Sulfitobacter sp. SK012 TaxID=1389005 RepID=UPI0013B46BA1|nr:hypothetical protein [Sulfitobacter sp. SK012]
MKILLSFALYSTILGGALLFWPQGTATSTDKITKARIVAGQAKFVSSDPAAVLDRGGAPSSSPFVVNLMAEPKQAPDRLSLGRLKKRQDAERRGYVTQRNGSASLPKHNDVRRMDALRFN